MANFLYFMRFYKISKFFGYQIRIPRQNLPLEKCLFEKNEEKNFSGKKISTTAKLEPATFVAHSSCTATRPSTHLIVRHYFRFISR